MVAEAAEAAAGALQYLGSGMSPLQVSPVLGVSAAPSPARGSGPGRAPAAAAAAAPELRCVPALSRRGVGATRPRVGRRGKGAARGLAPGVQGLRRPPGRASRGAGPSAPLGRGEGAPAPGASSRPHRRPPAASRSPRRPQGLRTLLTWVCGRFGGATAGPRAGAQDALPRLAPLEGRRSRPRPRPRPRALRGSSPARGASPFAAAAVTQRAGNGCGEGRSVRPSTRRAHPRPAPRRRPQDSQPPCPQDGEGREDLPPDPACRRATPAAVGGRKLWDPLRSHRSHVISKCSFIYLIFIEHLFCSEPRARS